MSVCIPRRAFIAKTVASAPAIKHFLHIKSRHIKATAMQDHQQLHQQAGHILGLTMLSSILLSFMQGLSPHTIHLTLYSSLFLSDEVYGPWTSNWKPNPFERAASRCGIAQPIDMVTSADPVALQVRLRRQTFHSTHAACDACYIQILSH
jgi:hypothetical protein